LRLRATGVRPGGNRANGDSLVVKPVGAAFTAMPGVTAEPVAGAEVRYGSHRPAWRVDRGRSQDVAHSGTHPDMPGETEKQVIEQLLAPFSA
jgi:hypothetical protein